jgi:hypothetical protein
LVVITVFIQQIRKKELSMHNKMISKVLISAFGVAGALLTCVPAGAQSAGQATASSGTPATTGAQSAAEAPTSSLVWSPAKDLGVFVFARTNQSADQQLKDESECYTAARQQSGIDPKAPPPAVKSEDQKKAEQQAAAEDADQVKGGRVAGAARGAAGGAAIGAIAGNAGAGAGAGAVAGTMRGGAAQRQANAASQRQAASKVAAQQQKEEKENKREHAEGLDTFQRAFGACMDARKYSVK